jgi:shikimate kinase
LLKTGDPAEILAKLADERRSFYSEAQIHVRSNGDGAHGDVVEMIVTAIQQHLTK